MMCSLIICFTALNDIDDVTDLSDEDQKRMGVCLQKLYWLEPCGSNFWLDMLIHFEAETCVGRDHYASFINF